MQIPEPQNPEPQNPELEAAEGQVGAPQAPGDMDAPG